MVLADVNDEQAPHVDDELARFAWLRGDPHVPPLSDWLAEREDERQRFRDDDAIAHLRARAAEALAHAAALPSSGAPSVAAGAVYSLDRARGSATREIVRRHAGKRPVTVFRPESAAVDWFFPGPRGRLLVVGTSSGGSEDSRARVVDTTTGRFLPDELTGTRHACVAWLPDESGFAYTCYPGGRPYGRQIRFHRLGTPQADDPILWAVREDSPDWPDIELSRDGAFALIHVSRGWSATDVHLRDMTTGATTPLVTPRLTGHEGLTRLHFTESGAIIGVTEVGTDRGRVVRVDPARPHADPGRPHADQWVTLLDETDVVLEDCSVTDDGVFVAGERGLTAVVGHVSLSDGAPGEPVWADLPLGDVAIQAPTPGRSTMRSRAVRHLSGQTAVFSWSRLDRPAVLCVWAPGSPPAPLDADAGDHLGDHLGDHPGDRPGDQLGDHLGDHRADGGPLRLRPDTVIASDGAAIPILIAEPDRTAGVPLPTLLHGYGGFGLSVHAGYSEVAAAWVALGGRYVEAGIRGGREKGRAWHRAGMREHRTRVFDDFADVAEGLVARGDAAPGGLAAWGSSNGGLLMAASVVRRPEAFAAVHVAVPLTDMLGYHRLSIARLWLSDYGDPDEPADRVWMRAYSPLHNLPAPGTELPDVLITTGLNDTRVDPYHAYAFCEALRERRAPGAPSRLILGVDRHGGHGIGKPADAFVRERADAFALFLAAFDRHRTDPSDAASD
jgi:prolyl oligopeptidase